MQRRCTVSLGCVYIGTRRNPLERSVPIAGLDQTGEGVIGGGSLRGGRGSVLGTLTGAAMMRVIASGCTALGLRNPVQDIIIGVIIVAAVALDQFRNRLAG